MVDFIERDNDKPNKLLRIALMEKLDEEGPMKPWTLVDDIDGYDYREKMDTVQWLVLKGHIRIKAGGDIRCQRDWEEDKPW